MDALSVYKNFLYAVDGFVEFVEKMQEKSSQTSAKVNCLAQHQKKPESANHDAVVGLNSLRIKWLKVKGASGPEELYSKLSCGSCSAQRIAEAEDGETIFIEAKKRYWIQFEKGFQTKFDIINLNSDPNFQFEFEEQTLKEKKGELPRTGIKIACVQKVHHRSLIKLSTHPFANKGDAIYETEKKFLMLPNFYRNTGLKRKLETTQPKVKKLKREKNEVQNQKEKFSVPIIWVKSDGSKLPSNLTTGLTSAKRIQQEKDCVSIIYNKRYKFEFPFAFEKANLVTDSEIFKITFPALKNHKDTTTVGFMLEKIAQKNRGVHETFMLKMDAVKGRTLENGTSEEPSESYITEVSFNPVGRKNKKAEVDSWQQ